jgi:Sulfotransferase family
MGHQEVLGISRTRFIFVHYHIFKNGGTTIESILRREFGAGFATVHGPADDSVLDGKDLTEFLRQRGHISAVSSHHLRYPKPVVPGWVIFDCCFLRHPLDRLVSLYNHLRRANSADPFCFRAHRQGPREFMQHLLRDFPHMVSEVQVTQLANEGIFARPANERDVERAMQVFRDMAVPGIVERFAESLVAAEYFLKPAFPKLRLHHVPENVSRPPKPYQPDRRDGIEQTLVELWGEDVFAALLRLNQFDMELFRRARIEIERRLSLLPDLRERLVDFGARCAPVVELRQLVRTAG